MNGLAQIPKTRHTETLDQMQRHSAPIAETLVHKERQALSKKGQVSFVVFENGSGGEGERHSITERDTQHPFQYNFVVLEMEGEREKGKAF